MSAACWPLSHHSLTCWKMQDSEGWLVSWQVFAKVCGPPRGTRCSDVGQLSRQSYRIQCVVVTPAGWPRSPVRTVLVQRSSVQTNLHPVLKMGRDWVDAEPMQPFCTICWERRCFWSWADARVTCSPSHRLWVYLWYVAASQHVLLWPCVSERNPTVNRSVHSMKES